MYFHSFFTGSYEYTAFKTIERCNLYVAGSSEIIFSELWLVQAKL